MMRRSDLSLLVLTLVVLVSSAAGAQTYVTGQSPGGAYYQIAVPDGWTAADGLVIWNHGFDLAPVGPEPDLGPLMDLQLSEGYAVAASSYSLGGWALFQTVADNRELVEAFEAEFGAPEQVLVTGASLGGIVTAQGIEVGGLGNVVGAMPICGALSGSRLWDGGVDLRLIYDAVCGDVFGAAIPGGVGGLPSPPDPSFNEASLAVAVNVCTGILMPPATRSADQAARLEKILSVTGLPEEFLLVDMGFVTFALADLVQDPNKLAGVQVFDNLDVDYGDSEINNQIERVVADQEGRRRFLDNYTPTGRVGDVKIVSLHTDKDGLVIVENESAYADVVPSENLSVGIVVEDTPSHCGFTQAELVAAWEALRGWVAGQPQPGPSQLQATCQGLEAGGLAEGPCRIDPSFVLPDYSGRVRDRGTCTADASTLCLNEDRFQARVSWTDFSGNTGSGRTTGLTTDDTGSFWFFNSENLELVVKALDGRPVNGHLWVFYASLTNVEFDLEVTDTETGLVKVYSNPSGNFASVGDTEAF